MTGRRTVRALTVTDRPALRALSEEAFGAWPDPPPPPPPSWPPAGMHSVGTFVDDRLVANVTGREYASWFGGTQIPTWGVAGVAVEAEHRGSRLLRHLVGESLAEARRRGAALTSLFATASGIYRTYGYELVADRITLEVPTAALSALPPVPGIRLRRATTDDEHLVFRTYSAWASRHNGPLTRTGPCFPHAAEGVTEAWTGVTLAEDDAGELVGYASWNRGSGWGADSRITVGDLIGLTPDATRALLRMLGSFRTVAGRVRIPASRPEQVDLVVPGLPPKVVANQHYMLRVLDLPDALEPRRFPPMLSGSLDLTVTGDTFGDLDGGWRITVAEGAARCARVGDAAGPVLTVGGLSALYAGALGMADLRLAGLAHGGDPTYDADLDALFVGPGVHIRDFF